MDNLETQSNLTKTSKEDIPLITKTYKEPLWRYCVKQLSRVTNPCPCFQLLVFLVSKMLRTQGIEAPENNARESDSWAVSSKRHKKSKIQHNNFSTVGFVSAIQILFESVFSNYGYIAICARHSN